VVISYCEFLQTNTAMAALSSKHPPVVTRYCVVGILRSATTETALGLHAFCGASVTWFSGCCVRGWLVEVLVPSSVV
jgi:hypothetical protein